MSTLFTLLLFLVISNTLVTSSKNGEKENNVKSGDKSGHREKQIKTEVAGSHKAGHTKEDSPAKKAPRSRDAQGTTSLAPPQSLTTSSDEGNDELLRLEVLHEVDSCDRKTAMGDVAYINFRIWFDNGTTLDDSRDHGDKPYEYHVGSEGPLSPVEDGLTDQCIGEIRRLSIDTYSSGKRQVRLLYDVEVLHIIDGPPSHHTFNLIDINRDGMLSRDEVSEYLYRVADDHEINFNGLEEHGKLLHSVFKTDDVDGDGVITLSEFQAPKHDEL